MQTSAIASFAPSTRNNHTAAMEIIASNPSRAQRTMMRPYFRRKDLTDGITCTCSMSLAKVTRRGAAMYGVRASPPSSCCPLLLADGGEKRMPLRGGSAPICAAQSAQLKLHADPTPKFASVAPVAGAQTTPPHRQQPGNQPGQSSGEQSTKQPDRGAEGPRQPLSGRWHPLRARAKADKGRRGGGAASTCTVMASSQPVAGCRPPRHSRTAPAASGGACSGKLHTTWRPSPCMAGSQDRTQPLLAGSQDPATRAGSQDPAPAGWVSQADPASMARSWDPAMQASSPPQNQPAPLVPETQPWRLGPHPRPSRGG
jgi:hypothetical protein